MSGFKPNPSFFFYRLKSSPVLWLVTTGGSFWRETKKQTHFENSLCNHLSLCSLWAWQTCLVSGLCGKDSSLPDHGIAPEHGILFFSMFLTVSPRPSFSTPRALGINHFQVKLENAESITFCPVVNLKMRKGRRQANGFLRNYNHLKIFVTRDPREKFPGPFLLVAILHCSEFSPGPNPSMSTVKLLTVWCFINPLQELPTDWEQSSVSISSTIPSGSH